jgi:hypothetical protein
MRTPAPDPYGFFGHIDRYLMMVEVLCALLVVIYAIVDNVFLLIVAIAGIIGVVLVQAIRNRKRRIHDEYEPNVGTERARILI